MSGRGQALAAAWIRTMERFGPEPVLALVEALNVSGLDAGADAVTLEYAPAAVGAAAKAKDWAARCGSRGRRGVQGSCWWNHGVTQCRCRLPATLAWLGWLHAAVRARLPGLPGPARPFVVSVNKFATMTDKKFQALGCEQRSASC